MSRVARWTVAVWLVVVIAVGYWSIVRGYRSRAESGEYIYWWDYRLVFFLMSWFPILVVALALVLWVERLIFNRRR